MPAGSPSSPDLAGDWARPSFDLATDSVGVLDGARLVAAAEVTRGGRRAEGAVLPGHRGRGIGTWLAAWTEHRAESPGHRVQTAPDGSLPQRLLLAVGTTWHTSWVLERRRAGRWPSGRCPPATRSRRPTLGSASGGVRGDPGRVRRVGRTGARHLRGLGGDDGTAPGASAVAAPRGRARRGRRGRVVHHRRQPGREGSWTSSPSLGRTAGRASRRPCWPTPSARPATTVRRAASCRPTHARARSTSTSRSGWRSPGCGPTW